MKRLLLTLFVLAVFFTSAVGAPAVECAVASAPIGESCKMDCCRHKSCCFESQKKQHELPKPPLTRDNGSHQQIVAIIAAQLATEEIQFPNAETSVQSTPIHIARLAPRPALLCTFLI